MHLYSLGVISAAIIAVAPRTRLTNAPHLLLTMTCCRKSCFNDSAGRSGRAHLACFTVSEGSLASQEDGAAQDTTWYLSVGCRSFGG